MPENQGGTPPDTFPQTGKDKRKFLQKCGKRTFWLWVGYQAIKGTLTTTFIWAPLIYWRFFS